MKIYDNYINRPFTAQLRGYFQQYINANDELGVNSTPDVLKTSMFVKKANELIADPKEHIATHHFREMLAGSRTPSLTQLEAIASAFTPEISLYGDLRENFIDSVRSPAEATRRMADDDDVAAKEERIQRLGAELSGHQKLLEEHEARIAGRQKMVGEWRRLNPKGKQDKPSLPEMIEDAYREMNAEPGRKAKRFKQLLERVQVEWDVSPEDLCAHMEKLNRKKDLPKKTLTNSIIYQWINHPEFLPNRESVLLLRESFGFDEQREMMLWKVIGGKVLDKLDTMIVRAEVAAGQEVFAKALKNGGMEKENEKKKKTRGALVTALAESSGIPKIHVEDTLGVHQLSMWKKGAIIEKREVAKRFVDLVHPPEDPADVKTHEQNARILCVLTRRPQSIDQAIDEASQAPHPGGALLLKLTGRYGLVSFTDDELAQGLSIKADRKKKIEADPVSTHKIAKMRTGTKLQRGGYIHERHANKILDMVEAKLKAEDSSFEILPNQRETCLEMMTDVPSPTVLFNLCKEGELFANEVLRMTRQRRGYTLDEAEKLIGLSSLSEFECGKKVLQHESARKVAKWLGLDENDSRDFVVMATGKQYDMSPRELLGRAQNPNLRCTSLRRIFDASGLTREELADRSGIDYSQIMYATQKRSGGRIVANEEQVEKLAELCGLTDQTPQFYATFSAPWAERADTGEGRGKKKSPERGYRFKM